VRLPRIIQFKRRQPKGPFLQRELNGSKPMPSTIHEITMSDEDVATKAPESDATQAVQQSPFPGDSEVDETTPALGVCLHFTSTLLLED
jgi:hypothetical protein